MAETKKKPTTTTRKPSAKKSEAVEAKAPVEKKTIARKTAARKAAAPVAEKPAAPVAPIRKAIAKRTTVRKFKPAEAAAARHGAPKTGRRTKVGMVVSAKMAKTVIVEVERTRQHPLYRKAVRLGKRFAAHTDTGDVLAGDLVRIQEGRPYSATKRWRVIEVISRAGEAGAAAPRVADVEKQLEHQEGVDEMLAPVKQAPVAVAEADGADETEAEGDRS